MQNFMNYIIKNKIPYLIIIISILSFNSIFAKITIINVKYKNSNKQTTLRVSRVGDVCFVSANELATKLNWNIVRNKVTNYITHS